MVNPQTSRKAVSKKRLRGSVLTLVVAMIAMIIVIGVAVISLIALFGGSCELQNSADAGVLSVARRCLTEINVKADQAAGGFFDDVSNKKHEINLENLNYCLAKVMLVEINQDAMASLGESTDGSGKNSSDVFQAARRLSTLLDERLADANKLKAFFFGVAQENSLRMLGNMQLGVDPPIDRAYLDRGEKSSVYIYPDEMPEGFNAAELKPVKTQGHVWLPGYVPLDIGARGFNFVPQPIRPPHLISQRYFPPNMNRPQGHGGHNTNDFLPVIANAYRMNVNAGSRLKVTTCAQADSVRDGFAMEMPHGFVRIYHRSPTNVLKIHDNVPMKDSGSWGKERQYTPLVNDPIFLAYKQIKPKIDELPTAWDVFMSKRFSEEMSGLKKKFVQRTKEILPGATDTAYDPPLAQDAVAEGDTTYAFRSNNKIHLRSEANLQDIMALANWLPPMKDLPPDGMSNNTDTVTVTRTTYLLSLPCPKTVAVGAKIEAVYFFQWKPGTGSNNVLGELDMGKNVFVRFLLPEAPPSNRYFKDDPPIN